MRGHFSTAVFCIVAILFFSRSLAAQGVDWSGEWITDQGPVSLEHNGDSVRGTFAAGGTITGSVDGAVLEGEYRKSDEGGSFKWTFDEESGRAFSGTRLFERRESNWIGWKRDPNAAADGDADFSGVWLSSMGTMQLEQDGNKVTGTFMSAKWGSLQGEVTGRVLTFDWQKFHFTGTTEIEMTPDRRRIIGQTTGDEIFSWFGVKPEGFEYNVEPKAGEMVKGIADNGMLYHLRMPDNWSEGDETDVIVLLHGSNWTTEGMVYITNENWPHLGRKFAILGIQGESWAKWSGPDDLRFNYTYINWVGKSTLGGFPGTDRESPYLVANVLDELKEELSLGRVIIGGHSQGGYLAYMMHMHFPDKIDGSFPIAGEVIYQAEPEAFDNEPLMENQRDTAMCILHGKKDQAVPFSSSVSAHNDFLATGFSKVKFLSPNMGHPYDFLPVDEAIRYLDMMSTDSADELLSYANEMIEKKEWRDVGLSIKRAMVINAGRPFAPVWEKYEAAAAEDAADHLRKIERNRNSKWVDDFLKYKDKFENADAAKEVISAYQDLREEHSEGAERIYKEAREAFQKGNRQQGMALYQQIADEYYASMQYRMVREILKK